MLRCALLAAALFASVPAVSLDLDAYASLLERHTREVEDLATVRVDYAALVDAPAWRALVAGLAGSTPPPRGRRAEHLAFWINVYNVLAIDVVVKHHPVESIRDVGSFLRPVWKRPAGVVGGETVTLDQVEHEILRPLGEPRIHAAIVCASASCPPLRREPYRAADLDRQLDENSRVWLADPRKGSRVEGRALRLSPILDWFGEDFAAGGGVTAFVRRHGPEKVRVLLEAEGDPPLRYFDYDWSLNGLPQR